jgi:2-polyprenyl-3-methyl-5-hydroxy-6-metoxy-1,4-benzoquinol methylase
MRQAITENGSETYLMGHTSKEYQRLRSQAKFLEPVTLRVLQSAGLKEGMHCLDVGCGTGDVMRLMGNRVGPSGSVTGMDIDEHLGKEAVSLLNELHNSRYCFHHGDITKQDPAKETYDFVFARLLLIHMTDPVGIVRKLFDAVKPSGTLVVMDNDFDTLRASEKFRHLTNHVKKLVSDAYRQAGKDPEAGTNLSHYFCIAGIGAPDGTDTSSMIFPINEAVAQIKAGMSSMKPAFVQSGLISADQLDKLFAELDEAAQAPNEFVLWFMHNSAWKKK